MANKTEYPASRDLRVEELDYLDGITEEEMATVSYVCTCTCSGGSEEPAPVPDQQIG